MSAVQTDNKAYFFSNFVNLQVLMSQLSACWWKSMSTHFQTPECLRNVINGFKGLFSRYWHPSIVEEHLMRGNLSASEASVTSVYEQGETWNTVGWDVLLCDSFLFSPQSMHNTYKFRFQQTGDRIDHLCCFPLLFSWIRRVWSVEFRPKLECLEHCVVPCFTWV